MILAAECLEMITPGMIFLAVTGVSAGLDQGEARPHCHRDGGEQERNETANQAWHPV
jgi:hypothetical protein